MCAPVLAPGGESRGDRLAARFRSRRSSWRRAQQVTTGSVKASIVAVGEPEDHVLRHGEAKRFVQALGRDRRRGGALPARPCETAITGPLLFLDPASRRADGLLVGFAIRRTEIPVERARALERTRPFGVDLDHVEPVPGAESDLSQALVVHGLGAKQSSSQQRGRLARPTERAHMQGEIGVCKLCREDASRRSIASARPRRRQGRIELALEAPLRIPFGLAMADEIDRGPPASRVAQAGRDKLPSIILAELPELAAQGIADRPPRVQAWRRRPLPEPPLAASPPGRSSPSRARTRAGSAGRAA